MVILTLHSLALLSIHTHFVHIEIVLKFTQRHALIENNIPSQKGSLKIHKKKGKQILVESQKKHLATVFVLL